jgi:hypothetical protein
MFYLFTDRADDTANANIRVSTTGSRASDPSRTSRTAEVTDDVRTAPPTEVRTTTVPGTGAVPVSAPAPDKGTVAINATLTTPNGSPRAAKSVKFYLLDKDVETILNEARIEPLEGNTLAGSLGLSMVYPDRFGDFQRQAMRAIASHVKYSGTTDGTGIANLAGVIPTNYYLFSVTRVGHGFAMWDSPVSVTAGENVMNLSPQAVTEIPDANG